MSDGELVRRARTGCSTSLAELVGRWSGKVLAFCHAQLRRPEVAADLAQDALLRSIRQLHTLQQPDRYGPWLRRIAHRLCLDWLKAKAQQTVPFSTLAAETSFEQQLVDKTCIVDEEELDELQQALHQLPHQHREALMLFYYGDMSYQQMAEVLEVSVATVNLRLTQGRQQLRERLIARLT
ncbi:MAG TPA: sigma-70 family RNA polymerase sigma factor [Gemmatales bacterium]|nr:sigma-70 family RNA polymerase sigma factor [Gemmatales bacterium]